MSDSAALSQLKEMGIPAGRARAALLRSKGDVMSAAERVFGGEFDDIASDDECDPGGNATIAYAPPTPAASVGSPGLRGGDLETDGQKISDGENDAEEGDDDEMEYEDDIGQEYNSENGDSEAPLMLDPYAGIFFSKDRTEDVIESVDEVVTAEVHVPGRKEKMGVQVLGSGEWMSGCPEGNEQTFLFQLYDTLAQEAMPCSHGCGYILQRDPKDFFAVFPDFPTYIAYLKGVIRPACPQCRGITCLACRERLTTSKVGAKGLGKKGIKEVQKEVEELLHCLPIQGVIIGVGLYMIEQAFLSGEASSSGASSPVKLPRPKSQKTGSIPTVGSLPATGNSTAASEAAKMQTLAGMPKMTLVADPDADEDFDGDEDDYAGYGGSAGKPAAKGTGYGGGGFEDRSGQKAAEEAQIARDKKTATLLNQVRVYLPSLNRPSGPRHSDHMVHPTALSHLRRRSAFVNDLLRNDSLYDMSTRSEIYCALFDWLEVISSHEALASMLAMPQMRAVNVAVEAERPNQRVVTYEGSNSPRELLENVVIQAEAALKGLKPTMKHEEIEIDEEALRMSKAEAERRERERIEAGKTDENALLRDFCNRIVESSKTIDRSLVLTKGKAFVDRMREALPRLPDSRTAIAEEMIYDQTEESVQKMYEAWASKARFQYCDMSILPLSEGAKVMYRHAYSNQLTEIGSMDAPKRSLAIAKELAILTTNLPVAWGSSIFLRVDEARVDCIKAMIIGPQGTPYENGCFLFDIFLPLDYNTRCPLVKSMTTNGGKYRYNPNLYADGKVCLSLLGTWSGPGWISGQSTLLQVLISIQSLILCEEPYLNEPGWAGSGGSASSKKYSTNVRRMCVIDAMANNIRAPPHPFENEILTHFRLKAKSIKVQLENWKALDDGLPVSGDCYGGGPLTKSGDVGSASDTAFAKAADEVVNLLDGLTEKKE